MENNQKNRDLYELYIELGHDAFEEKIKKPMEICLHNSGSNFISMNSLNTIIANAMEKSKLEEAGFDEYDIFSPPSFEEKIFFDDTLPPIYDDYNDGCASFTPTITNETVYAYVESNDTFMHVDHDKNALCDSYIVEFIHDATENYFERGKYGYRNLHVTKFLLFMMKVLSFLLIFFYMMVSLRPTGPYERGIHGFIYLNNIKSSLFMLKLLKLHLFCLPMLVTLCFIDLFSYKIPLHRKWIRLKCV